MRSILDCVCGDKMRDAAPLILRVATGAIFAMHGWQKLSAGVPNVSMFLGQLGFPAPELFAVLLIAAELGGGILLILGLFTHWVAKVLAFVAVVALVLVHMKNGFFMSAGGYEFIMLLFAASFSLMVTGPGKWSLDRKMRKS